MRVFIVLNETESNPHVDVRNALQVLTSRKVIAGYEVFPFLARLEAGLKPNEVIRELVQRAANFQPTAILWAHTASLSVTKDHLGLIRHKCNNPAFGYWDGDLYEAPYKRLPAEVVQLASSCDVVFAQGFGPMTEGLAAAGCADIRFVPGTTDEWRFGKRHAGSPEFDVVLIGNNASSRLPWRRMPGARWRAKIVKLFERKLGRRFAVFGHGWRGPSAQGPLPFEKQSEAYGNGRVALGVNNLHASYYFSNRLPIAMSSCVPVVYNYEQGFESLFPAESGCLFYRDTREAWDLTHKLLSGKPDRLVYMAEAAYRVSTQKFTITRVFHYICDVLKTFVQARGHCHVFCANVVNPWLISRPTVSNCSSKVMATN